MDDESARVMAPGRERARPGEAHEIGVFADPTTSIAREPIDMTAAKRKLVTRVLILGANLATIAVIVKVATVSPIRAVVLVVACVLVVLVLQRREVGSFLHRMTGRY